eukprot:1408580-Rhodomonas_salina.1
MLGALVTFGVIAWPWNRTSTRRGPGASCAELEPEQFFFGGAGREEAVASRGLWSASVKMGWCGSWRAKLETRAG